MAQIKFFFTNNPQKNIKRYFQGKFQPDLTAGLTVTMVVIPQAMAYAAIAGINPIYGLYTAIIPTIIAAIFGSFPFLITGPTNPTALVTASVLISFASKPDYFEFVVALAVISGLFNIIFGLLKLGSIIRYISNSVLVGFLSSVGVLIIGHQLGNLFGIELSREAGLWGILTHLIGNFSNINVFSLIVSGTSITIMMLIRKLNRKLPDALIAIMFATLLIFLTGWSGAQNIKLVRDFGLPDQIGLGFHIPQLTLGEFASLGTMGAAVALFGLMETLSIAKAMSQMTGEPLNPSRQMLGQGLASFVGGFFQCMPASGSPSRTVINVVSGAKTRISAIVSGVGVLVFLMLFSGLLSFIPIPVLAAVVIVSAAGLVDINLIKLTWQSRVKSRLVMVITFISTLVLPLEYAIYLGVLTSILIYLDESSHMNLSYIVEDEDGQFVELPMEGIKKSKPQIAIVNIEGDLYFAAVEDLQEKIEKVLEIDLKVLILRFRRTHLLASTGIMALEQLIRSAHEKGIQVLFSGVQAEVFEPLDVAGITGIVGDSHVFLANHHLFESTQRALNEAKAIIKSQKNSMASVVDSASEEKGANV